MTPSIVRLKLVYIHRRRALQDVAHDGRSGLARGTPRREYGVHYFQRVPKKSANRGVQAARHQIQRELLAERFLSIARWEQRPD